MKTEKFAHNILHGSVRVFQGSAGLRYPKLYEHNWFKFANYIMFALLIHFLPRKVTVTYGYIQYLTINIFGFPITST